MSLKNEEKDKRSRLILFFVILALLVVNGALIINLLNKKSDIEEIKVENDEISQLLEHTIIMIRDGSDVFDTHPCTFLMQANVDIQSPPLSLKILLGTPGTDT